MFLLSQDDYTDYISRRRATTVTQAPDLDEAAGESDAEHEGIMEGEGEEELPHEDDAVMEVAPATTHVPLTSASLAALSKCKDPSPGAAVADNALPASAAWLPTLKKLDVMKLGSSTSIGEASVAPTVMCTPSPKPLPNAPSLTPSPVSPPVVVKEVFLIAESPVKMTKVEIPEELNNSNSDGVLEPKLDRRAMKRELALLEAQLFSSQLLRFQS